MVKSGLAVGSGELYPPTTFNDLPAAGNETFQAEGKTLPSAVKYAAKET